MPETTLDLNATYRVKGRGWHGIAVRIYGYPQLWEPCTYLATNEDETEEWEEVCESGDGEWIDDIDSGCVLVVMVGDDQKHHVEIEDLEMIDELDYCSECGQIGCCHDGRERD